MLWHGKSHINMNTLLFESVFPTGDKLHTNIYITTSVSFVCLCKFCCYAYSMCLCSHCDYMNWLMWCDVMWWGDIYTMTTIHAVRAIARQQLAHQPFILYYLVLESPEFMFKMKNQKKNKKLWWETSKSHLHWHHRPISSNEKKEKKRKMRTCVHFCSNWFNVTIVKKAQKTCWGIRNFSNIIGKRNIIPLYISFISRQTFKR